MAKSTNPKGGRVTPKQNKRYTPPVPRSQKVSPLWVPIVMFTALGLGMLIILANYVDLLPGDGPSNYYLLVGLGSSPSGSSPPPVCTERSTGRNSLHGHELQGCNYPQGKPHPGEAAGGRPQDERRKIPRV